MRDARETLVRKAQSVRCRVVKVDPKDCGEVLRNLKPG